MRLLYNNGENSFELKTAYPIHKSSTVFIFAMMAFYYDENREEILNTEAYTEFNKLLDTAKDLKLQDPLTDEVFIVEEISYLEERSPYWDEGILIFELHLR